MKKLALLSIFLALPLMAQPKHAMLGAAMGQGSTPASPYIALTWTASPTAGTLVNIYRCVGTPCTATSSFTKLVSGEPAGGPYNDTAVTAGTYSYYVTATLNGAESAASNIATASVLPQPPTGLTTTATP